MDTVPPVSQDSWGMSPFNWNDLRFFLAMARTGSPTAVAMQLKVDHTTVRRRIAALEEALNCRLFEPRDRGFFLTPSGEKLLPIAESMEAVARSGEASIAGSDKALSGAVRVGAPDGLGSMFLTPHLAHFATLHPELQIEIDASARSFNLAKREADIAISITPPVRGRQVVRKLTSCRMYLYAAQEYLDRSGRIEAIEDLKNHRLLGYIDDMQFAQDFNAPAELTFSPHRFLSTNLVALYQATLAGAGICLLPAYMMTGPVKLQRILPDQLRVDREIWMTIHADLKDIARYRAVANFIYETVAKHRESFM